MSHLNKTRNGHTFQYIDAWEALKKRDLQYAINLLVSGEWTIDGVIKDGWSSLDARKGLLKPSSSALDDYISLRFLFRRVILSRPSAFQRASISAQSIGAGGDKGSRFHELSLPQPAQHNLSAYT
ncbi:hypothetical protein BKA60DRAFT_548247 [Fusarium oxysporum]|nr:hypothetical protein BKA60DRAFT_548247 [Fusarium oxysporum]